MPDLPALSPLRTASVHMLARWMGERFYRTFRLAEDDRAPFDAVLQQRERRVGVTAGVLWDEAVAAPGAATLAEMLTSDAAAEPGIEDGAYAIWVPPQATLPTEEPGVSNLRIFLTNGLKYMQPGERREVRLPVSVKLAKMDTEGAYVSVTGGLSSQWLAMSDGMPGSYHLDSRSIHRLSEEEAETEILVTRVRDRAAVLQPGELSDVPLHDYWLVSRLPDTTPPGVTVIAAPPQVDPLDGTGIRRHFRREVQRAVDQKQQGDADLAVLVVTAPVAHMKDELVTASLKGMNPVLYGALDLVALVADGAVRQVLQPRSLPWEEPR
ncbi:MAG: hypothetical protein M0R73_05530 [Dehalococcoidia bacterium]|nr:hypothetical protein [Dehalococcoidia bacterium]